VAGGGAGLRMSFRRPYAGLRRSITVDFDDRLGKGLRDFLGQIVTDAASDQSMRVLTSLLDFERSHQGDDIDGNHRLLSIPGRFTREKARRAIAPQKRDDHPVACRCQERGDIDVTVNVVGPAVPSSFVVPAKARFRAGYDLDVTKRRVGVN